MKTIVTKIFATLLSLIVLMSSMSFTIDKHFCGDTLVDISYLGKADDCGMKMHKDSESMSIKKKNCCKNTTEYVDFDAFNQEKVQITTAQEIEFLVFYVYSYLNLYQELKLDKEFYKNFSPPDISKDTQILYETFLI